VYRSERDPAELKFDRDEVNSSSRLRPTRPTWSLHRKLSVHNRAEAVETAAHSDPIA
jgi:hypothetical protein